jgi:cytochrome c oxidase assembly protein subunit 15
MTGVCTTLVAILVAWTFLARPRHDRARRAVVWCGVLLITEALLGALLVKGGYVENNASNMRVVMQCIHFTNTMLLLAAVTLTWWWLRDRPQPVTKFGPRARIFAWTSLIATLFVGATGSVAALADTLFPPTSVQAAFLQDFAASSPLLIRMRWLHPATAIIALACALWIALQLRSKLGQWVVGLVCAQILLGATNVLLLAPTWMQVLHLLGADLYWIALVIACATVLAPLRSSAAVTP